MLYKTIMHRPSLVAITAALALSATPAFAQTADAPAAEPVTIAPPAPIIAPDAPAITASTVDTSSNMAAPAETAPVATRSPVVVHTPEASEAAAPVTRTAMKLAPAVRATPTVRRTETPAPTAKAVTATPAAVPAPAPIVTAPSPVQTQRTVTTRTNSDETGLYAGLGGAALLILGGGAYALSRRNRRDDEEAYETEYATDETVVEAAPVARMVPTPASQRDSLPSGFDLSRFGPHTRAAYQGPTEDNPSLSLKKRLKVASFLDGRLRDSGGLEDQPVRASAKQGRSLFGSKLSDRLSFRPEPRGGFRPAIA